jgi:hypothetical protein
MHPETLRIYEAARKRGENPKSYFMPVLTGPHHFHVTPSVCRAASAIAVHKSVEEDDGAFRAPVTARLPANSMVLTMAEHPGEPPLVWVLGKAEDAEDEVVISLASSESITQVCSYIPGEIGGRQNPNAYKDFVWYVHRRIAMIVSLINTPRKVDITTPSGLDWTRQHRKAVERVTGSAAMAFSIVSWELGRRCKAVGNEISTEGHPKALHWCRAHWREAAKGQPKAEWVYVPALGGWGWRTWVTDCWKGHPDYGVKLQRHQPRMPGEKPETSKASGQAVLDKTRWEAMSAAHRAAMVEAGFAPTTTVQ